MKQKEGLPLSHDWFAEEDTDYDEEAEAFERGASYKLAKHNRGRHRAEQAPQRRDRKSVV